MARSRSTSQSPAKVQRWIDLLAALLVRSYPAPFEELARDVPAYGSAGKSESALMRMFERDKDELRAFGVPIETLTVDTDDGPRGAYRLRRQDFYLPYLYATAPSGMQATPPRRLDRFGYQALATLAFEPDELVVVGEAASRVRALGDPLLTAEADSAVRKLAVDVPIDAAREDVMLLHPTARAQASVFATLSDALVRKKIVHFDYRAMQTDETERRTVEPYGLFFLHTHWYLVGRDRDRGELRNFRLNRISSPEVNSKRAQSADYEIPTTFHLREHARSRQAWELGDDAAIEAVVEFRNATGAAAAAARLGARVPGASGRRRFDVRRLDAFARWLMSFGGDAVPIAPLSLVAAFEDQVQRTLALYDARPAVRIDGDDRTRARRDQRTRTGRHDG
ncbi:MAG TPA: WYL domain-containing protein [Gemmatimonadaceae bacterium]|nr:WYL domain-containing protein [Gemmatimonadaceae bacterium]